jgi:spore photoproduct lyase
VNLKTYYTTRFDRIYVTGDAAESEALRRARSVLPDMPLIRVAGKDDIPADHLTARTILLTSPRGEVVGRCQCRWGEACCNYLTVDIYAGCSLGCSYCVMKSYLNFAPLTVFADPRPGLSRIREIAARNPDRAVRVGSGEVGDSLLLDPIFGLSGDYIAGLADLPNVFFESKTKTNFVSHILGIKEKGNAVIGFSVNPQEVVDAEEADSAPVGERLQAAREALASGFRVAFHIDPIFAGFEDQYRALVRELKSFPADRIAWISLGMFRYSGALKERRGARPYLAAEFVESGDGKFRYLQKQRIRTYREILKEFGPGLPVYLCMESRAVWKYASGCGPEGIPALKWMFSAVRGAGKHRRTEDRT